MSFNQGRIQDFGQGGGGSKILGTKILSKFRNKKFEKRYKIGARRDKTTYIRNKTSNKREKPLRIGIKPLEEGTKPK